MTCGSNHTRVEPRCTTEEIQSFIEPNGVVLWCHVRCSSSQRRLASALIARSSATFELLVKTVLFHQSSPHHIRACRLDMFQLYTTRSGRMSRPPASWNEQALSGQATLQSSESAQPPKREIIVVWRKEGHEDRDQILPGLLPYHKRAKWRAEVRKNAYIGQTGIIEIDMTHIDLPDQVSREDVWLEAAEELGWWFGDSEVDEEIEEFI